MGQSTARVVLAAPLVVMWIVGSIGLVRALIKEPEADQPFVVFGLTMGLGALGTVLLLT